MKDFFKSESTKHTRKDTNMAKTILKKKPTVTVEETKPKRGRKPKNAKAETIKESTGTRKSKVNQVNDSKAKKKSESLKKSVKRPAKEKTDTKAVKTTKTTKKAKEVIKSAQIPASENQSLMDVIKQQKQQIQDLQNKHNSNFVDLRKQVQENQKENSKILSSILKAEKDNETLRQRVKTAQVKYRTKYMQLEHEKKQWNQTKQDLLNVIADLKMELVKYAPDSELFDVVTKITQITAKNHVAVAKTIKMPKEN